MSDELAGKVEAELGKIPDHSKQDVIDAAERVKSAAKKLNGVTDYPYPDEYFEWIVPYYERFHQRDPDEPKAMISELSRVRAKLKEAGPIAVAGTETALRNWEGEAASSFSRFYAAAFPDCVDNQVAVVDELRSGLWLYSTILKSQRSDAIGIAEATVAALESSDDMKNSEGKHTFAILAALGTILGAVTTGGISIGIKIVGGAASLATAQITKSSEGKTATISGTQVPDILNQMASRLGELDKTCVDAETAIGTDLEGSVSAVKAILDSRNATELMQLVPNEIGDDGSDVTDGVDNDIPQFRPAA